MLELSAPVIAIVGPTASGKTDTAQIVAERLGGEVVSADSMQIYRGMDIGTGKLPASERRVPHHGFDLVDPGEPYSAALFQAFARHCIRDIDPPDKVPKKYVQFRFEFLIQCRYHSCKTYLQSKRHLYSDLQSHFLSAS